MTLDTDNISTESRVTKENAAPPPVTNDGNGYDLSAMADSTLKYKVKKYADEAVKAVVVEYSDTILNMTSDIEQKDDRVVELEFLFQSLNAKPRRGFYQ